MGKRVVKILRADQWRTLRDEGRFDGSDADLRDGFIHLSLPEQVEGTLQRHFADRHDLWLVSFDADTLGDALRWEPSRGGALFPHLYGPLTLDRVVDAAPLARA
ncbi:MAG: DUF952 domain-containing protein [Deltaproteobacteria bacterium]|nr:DUF952 domain-containing protein [Deltaproteobacteria bacterium]